MQLACASNGIQSGVDGAPWRFKRDLNSRGLFASVPSTLRALNLLNIDLEADAWKRASPRGFPAQIRVCRTGSVRKWTGHPRKGPVQCDQGKLSAEAVRQYMRQLSSAASTAADVVRYRK